MPGLGLPQPAHRLAQQALLQACQLPHPVGQLVGQICLQRRVQVQAQHGLPWGGEGGVDPQPALAPARQEDALHRVRLQGVHGEDQRLSGLPVSLRQPPQQAAAHPIAVQDGPDPPLPGGQGQQALGRDPVQVQPPLCSGLFAPGQGPLGELGQGLLRDGPDPLPAQELPPGPGQGLGRPQAAVGGAVTGGVGRLGRPDGRDQGPQLRLPVAAPQV